MVWCGRRGVDLRLGESVDRIEHAGEDGGAHHSTCAVLKCGERLPFGALIWSAGLAPVKFVSGAPFGRAQGGRLAIDDYLRVVGEERVFALGDCAAHEDAPLPPTASVAEQQGAYLAACFNQT